MKGNAIELIIFEKIKKIETFTYICVLLRKFMIYRLKLFPYFLLKKHKISLATPQPTL